MTGSPTRSREDGERFEISAYRTSTGPRTPAEAGWSETATKPVRSHVSLSWRLRH